MKTHRIILLSFAFTLTSGAMLAVELESTPQSDYARAVQTYVDAATDQLHAIRADIDAQVGTAPSDETKKRFDPVYAKLEKTEKLLAALKKAGPGDFDRIKLRFEQTRADMIKTSEAARKT